MSRSCADPHKMDPARCVASRRVEAGKSPLPRRRGRAYVGNRTLRGARRMAIPHLVTAEELARLGERDFDFELVSGNLVPVTPAGGQHGALAMLLGARIHAFVDARALGRVYAAETGYI